MKYIYVGAFLSNNLLALDFYGRRIKTMASFEEQIVKLEETVRKLERGDISLDESLALFEEGVKLTKDCQEQLNKAEKKVKILINGEEEDFDVNEKQA